MILTAVTLISDFTSVLIDVRDNLIILPRPVNDKTVVTSRILHIAIHVMKLVTALALPGICVAVYLDSWCGLFIIPEILLAALFAVFIVNVVYLSVIKYSKPAKFNNVITYIQIAFSVIVFVGYQALPRMISRVDLNAIDPLTSGWAYVIPSVWFAALYDVIVHPQSVTLLKLALSAAGIFCPLAAMIYVVKVLAPGFDRMLSSVSANGETRLLEPASKQLSPASKKKGGLADRLSRFVSSNKVEQAGFRLTWRLTSRYRDFKMKVYPSFAYVTVCLLYFIFLRPQRHGGGSISMDQLRLGKAYIMIMYFTPFILAEILNQISMSEKYKAAWMMFTTGHDEPGKILSGMFKAIILKYYLPFFTVISLCIMVLWGPFVINDLLLAFFNGLLYGVIYTLFSVEYLPFSQPVVIKSGRIFSMLLATFCILPLGLIHYFAARWEWMVTVLLLICAGIFWLLFSYFRNRNWSALEADYD
jgi:hypothetical protein